MRTALRVKFPDHQGKYREFRDFDRLEAELQPKRHCLLSGFRPNSLLNEQGIILKEQGIRSGEQGKPLTGIALKEGYPQAIETTNESGRIKY